MKKILFISVILSFLLACSSKLIFKSDPPEASVFARAPGTSEKFSLGRTPLKMNVKDFEKQTKVSPASGDFIEILFEKDGFRTETLLIPPTRLVTTETVIGIKMRSGPNESQIADKLLQYIDNAQKFTQNKEFERALIELDRALELSPKFVKALISKAHIFFLRGQYQDALSFYEKALLYEPRDEDSIRMISFIREKKLNGSVTEKR